MTFPMNMGTGKNDVQPSFLPVPMFIGIVPMFKWEGHSVKRKMEELK